jgi:hypothetical protein
MAEERPITKKDLDAAIDRLREFIADRIEASETRLLATFHRSAEISNARLEKLEMKQRIDGDWLVRLEHRVRALEERLDFPNQPRTH